MHSLLSSISDSFFVPSRISLKVILLSAHINALLQKLEFAFFASPTHRPEAHIVELFRFQHLITSCSVQPLTVQCGLNEELIKCILCCSSRLPAINRASLFVRLVYGRVNLTRPLLDL